MTSQDQPQASGEPLPGEQNLQRGCARINGNSLPTSERLMILSSAGSAGSVVARRLAENPDVSVLLLEAGGDDEVPEVMEAGKWPTNLGSERDWGFSAIPNPRLNGRAMTLNMGRVLSASRHGTARHPDPRTAHDRHAQ